MGYKKESSKCCKKCSVEWLPDMSNKYPKRALCRECNKIEYQRVKAEWNAKQVPKKSKLELLQPYKASNRTKHWRAINSQLKPLTKIDDIHNFIVQQADKVFGDKALMEYISKQI